MTAAPPRLSLLPVSLFGAVMGVAGTAVAWRIAADRWDAPALDPLPHVFAWAAAALFVTLAVAYAAKAVRHLDAVRAEWAHPVKMAFVPTISIALLVLARAVGDTGLDAAGGPMWWTGAALQLAFTVGIVRAWISRPDITLAHVHPGWFIPAVGNIVAPIAGVRYAPHAEILWLFFGVGVVYWLGLLPMVFSRLVATEPLPKPLTPTLAILVAPPAVGAAAWGAMYGAGEGDALFWILLSAATFQALVLASQARELWRAPFGPPTWALTFPLAALASALLAAPRYSSVDYTGGLGAAALASVTAIVLTVGTRAALGLARGTYLVAEPAPARNA